MKKLLTIILLLCLTNLAEAKKISFKLTNTSVHQVNVYSQIINGIEKENQEFLFVLNPNETKSFEQKVKRGQKIKFLASGGGVESLPLVKGFDLLDKKETNSYELVLPILDKLDVIELNDAIAKLKNDNILKILTDSTQYAKDELPPLGTFLFINKKAGTILPLVPSNWWSNTHLIRTIDNQYFSTTNYINSSNVANLKTSGVPFLRSLSATFNKSNIMEVNWEIQNAHIKQWQPADKNVYEILQHNSNEEFIKSCVQEMNEFNLGGGDYQLLFISSAYVVDKIKISGRKYNSVSFSAEVDAQLPPTGVEVVQPIGVEAGYKYTRVKTYSNIDSTLNAYLKFIAQDYTPALKSYLTEQTRNAQKKKAIATAQRLKSTIIEQYAALKSIDNSLVTTNSVDVIIPIILVTINKPLRSETFDSLNNNITSQEDLIFNNNVKSYNSILANLQDNISFYKSTLESIDKLGQTMDTDYQRVNNLTQTIEVDKKIIDSFVTNYKQTNLQK